MKRNLRLYVVTDCHGAPTLQEPIGDPARLPWHEVTKVDHYYVSVAVAVGGLRVREGPADYDADGQAR